MQNILIVGASGHAGVVIDIVEKQGQYQIAGLVDTFQEPGTRLLGYQVLGGEQDLPALIDRHGVCGALIAIGDNWIRSQMAARIRRIAPELEFVRAFHPSAQIARAVSIGAGTVVMAGAIVNTGSRIGEFAIINTKASVDHDNQLEDFSSLAPNATTGGRVTLGLSSVLALGANVVHGVRIGRHVVIGAGATVLHDIPDLVLAYGTPARVVRSRQAGDKYL